MFRAARAMEAVGRAFPDSLAFVRNSNHWMSRANDTISVPSLGRAIAPAVAVVTKRSRLRIGQSLGNAGIHPLSAPSIRYASEAFIQPVFWGSQPNME